MAFALAGCGGPPPPPPDSAQRLLSVSLAPPPPHGILALRPDLAGAIPTPLFRAPAGAEVRQLDVAADGRTLVYAWVPPPGPDAALLDRSELVAVDLAAPGWQPVELLGGETAGEYLLEPALSPDGRYCYHVRVAPTEDYLTGYTSVTLRRLDLRSGEVTDIIDNGIWPTVSPDGRRIAFVGVQPQSQQRGLFVANADGRELAMLVPVGRFFDVDAPVFSPDGRWIWFAVAEEDERDARAGTWWERLLPFAPAYAHNDHDVPSDWWRVSVDGGEPERMTDERRIMTYGEFLPDGRFAYATTDGVFLLPAAGTAPTLLARGGAFTSLAWARVASDAGTPHASGVGDEPAGRADGAGDDDEKIRALLEGPAAGGGVDALPLAWRALVADVEAGRIALADGGVPRELDTRTTRESAAGHFVVTLAPPADGIDINRIDTWTIDVRTPDGTPVRGAQIDVIGGMPLHDHGFPTAPRVGEEVAPGRYPLRGMRLGMRGWWQVLLAVRADTTVDTVAFDLVVAP